MAFRKRSDATYLGEIPPLRRIIPYLMPSRPQSAVYFPQRIEVEHLLAWLEETNAGRPASERVTLFHVFLGAVARTVRLRPETNRFVSGGRTYLHKDISISFIVKAELTDEAPESEVRLVFTGEESVEQVRDMVDAAVHRERTDERGGDDRLVDFFASWPRPVLRMVARLVGALDYHNLLPRALREAIPLYTSIYVVNVGSIGIDPPFHHLYEHGSASAFIALGKVDRVPVVDEDGEVVARRCVNVVHTLDERATDGFYYARTAEVFRRLLAEPELLGKPGITAEEILADRPGRG